MKRYKRNQSEVDSLMRKVRIMRKHGLNWSSIARVLEIARPWLMNKKEELSIQ